MATKRIKPTPVTGRAECEQLIDELARLEVDRQVKVAALKDAHQQLDDDAGPEIEDLENRISGLMARVEPYIVAHQAEMFKPGQREGETVLSRYGIRLGNPTVGKDRKYTWDDLCETFDLDPKTRKFVRTKSTVDKEALLKGWREGDPDFKSISDRGLVKITQGETVWVEAKADAQVAK